MTKEPLTMEALIPADPDAVYDLLIDPVQHAAFTGRGATGGTEVGDAGSAYDGQIQFVNRELVRGQRIVLDWRLEWEEWPKDVWSHVVFELEPEGDGTRVVLTQSGVPDRYADHMAHGWQDHYLGPMATYLGARTDVPDEGR